MLSNHKGESVLDRAAVESDAPNDDLAEHQETVDTAISLSKRKRLSGKLKSLLHVSDDQVNIASNADCVTLADSPEVVPGESRLDETAPPKPGPQGFQQLIQHPVDTLKAKTQRKTNKEVAANLLSPEVTHAQDVELIHAQDSFDNARTESEKAKACEDLETLKKARQDLFVRWTMDRHILKLKSLERKTTLEPRHREHGSEPTPKTGEVGWKAYSQQLVLQQAEKYGGQYIGSFSEPPLASQETVSASVERLLIASSPWQEMAMHIRRIYRWENRRETSAYLVAFTFLWVYGALCAAACLALVAQVLRRRFEKPSVEKLRQDVTRIEDSLSTAHTLSEQIEKRGAQSWVDPLIEVMGEWLLLQLGDMANLLEILLNFYEWRQPVRTAWTLAEWAIARLQAEGRWQANLVSDSSEPSVQSHGSYTCSSGKHGGRLVVTSQGIQFQPFVTSHNQWKVAFNKIKRMEKVNTIAQVGSGKDLLFYDADDLSYSASNVAKRDEVFTQIVGYSNVKWQVVG
ncbi:MAG: hypothetical protein L6R42_001331 [Xanthoria sp. 1 TBL-2021]|nr:MAG: hypothetical protein L6R42_001331 [Xanthoria sp. 1 TBL-2021]